MQQHLDKEFTIAVPLLKNNHTNYLVIEYKGEEHQRFNHLIKYFFKTIQITEYYIYQGKDIERLQVFIKVDNFTLEEADAHLEEFSNTLKIKMIQNWKCLPSASLPDSYNIVTLPYQKL